MAQSPPAPPLDHAPSLDGLSQTPAELERSDAVDFSVDRDAEVAVGVQLGWKIRAMIARGALREGDRLPSVRELASFSEVNVNTGRAVYNRLEQEGLIASEHGRGTFVTSRAGSLLALGNAVEDVVDDLRGRGVDPRQIATALYGRGGARDADRPDPPVPVPVPDGADESALRSELRRQVAFLEEEIAAYAWHDRRDLGESGATARGTVPHLADSAELTETRDRLLERLTRLRGEAKQRGDREEGARAHVESMVRDPARHRWEVIRGEDLGEPSCVEYRVMPRFGPVGAIMGWWRVKVSSGCP